MHFPSTRRAAALFSLAAVAALAGCSTHASAGSDAEPAVATVPVVADFRAFTLPLDAYQPDGAQLSQIMRAERSLALTCLRGFGFDIQVPADATAPFNPNARRYGVTDLTEASTYGYKAPPEMTQRARTPQLSPAAQAVMMGTGQNVAGGHPVPQGGCLADARRTVEIDPAAYEDGLTFVASLRSEAYERSRQDSRVRQAVAAWSSCMAAAGYHYADPMAANDDPAYVSAQHAGPDEIRTAVADVGCKKTSHYADEWAAVETAYQQRLVQRNLQRLNEIRDRLQQTVRTAAAKVAG